MVAFLELVASKVDDLVVLHQDICSNHVSEVFYGFADLSVVGPIGPTLVDQEHFFARGNWLMGGCC